MDVREAPIISSRHPRPFYGAFAWAYDLLTDHPVAAECTEIAATLAARGVRRGGALLDAGCGTGRHPIELSRPGYRMTGLDAAGPAGGGPEPGPGRGRARAGRSHRRKSTEPLHERAVDTPRGVLTFRSLTRLDHATRQMLSRSRTR
jgi:SAM-dependent methyltransferase